MRRFINADVIDILQLTQGELISHNLFAYCKNNPVNNYDPSGYWAQYYKGFYWTYAGFSLIIRRRFLSKWFCLYYARDIKKVNKYKRRYKIRYWYRGRYRYRTRYSYHSQGVRKMSVHRIAVEIYAHAVGYYYGRTLNKISRGRFGNRLMVHGSYIDVNRGDPWLRYYYAVWYAG